MTEVPERANDSERVPQLPTQESARFAPAFVMSDVRVTMKVRVEDVATVAAVGARFTVIADAADTPSVAVPPMVDWALTGDGKKESRTRPRIANREGRNLSTYGASSGV